MRFITLHALCRWLLVAACVTPIGCSESKQAHSLTDGAVEDSTTTSDSEAEDAASDGFVTDARDARPSVPDAAEDTAEDTAKDTAKDTAEDTAEDTQIPPDASARCENVAHIGDSLTARQEDEIVASYREMGINAQVDGVGGRGILHPYHGDTGLAAAQRYLAAGFDGCWVIALGTNDTANISAGAKYSRGSAIDRMMQKIDATKTVPVMWVNTFTTGRSDHYSNVNMVLWNEALTQARSRWPNMRIYDWATTAAAHLDEFNDGIHLTSAGKTRRHKAVANSAKSQLLAR